VSVRLEIEPGAWVRATIDRPAAMNAIDDSVVAGLEAAVDRAEAERARVLVLRGAGGTFCAGADLAYVLGLVDDRAALGRYVQRLATVLDRIEAAPFASLCVVEGYALAGGCEILLACDIVLAAADAKIGDRHLEYGLLPGAGGSVRLARSLPSPRARWLLLSGELLSGTEAAEWGLVTRAVAPAELEAAVEAQVARLASRSRDALATAKRMAIGLRDLPFDEAIRAERELFLDHFLESPDGREGLAAFAERRPPRFD
jgi:enoyl-CoA hydratase/carnithine racemase